MWTLTGSFGSHIQRSFFLLLVFLALAHQAIIWVTAPQFPPSLHPRRRFAFSVVTYKFVAAGTRTEPRYIFVGDV
jgi:hypothetical protein